MKLIGMPNEDYKIQRGYEPNTVKVEILFENRSCKAAAQRLE